MNLTAKRLIRVSNSSSQQHGVTLVELVLVVLIIGILATTAYSIILDLRSKAVESAEMGIVGSVRSGIANHAAESKVIGRVPLFPETLDESVPGDASPGNPLFVHILVPSVQSGWKKISSERYQGPTQTQYAYKSATGSFEAVNTLLASYTFEGGMGDWTVTQGNTIGVIDDKLVLGNGNYVPENRAFAGDAGWTDYVIETTAVLHGGSGYGIFFRTQNPNSPNGYTFQYDSLYGGGEFIFRRWDNGSERSPFARAKPADPAYQWHGVERQIRIEVSGNTFSAYVDGALVLTGSDSTYGSGAIGVRSWHNSFAEFDGFTISEP